MNQCKWCDLSTCSTSDVCPACESEARYENEWNEYFGRMPIYPEPVHSEIVVVNHDDIPF